MFSRWQLRDFIVAVVIVDTSYVCKLFYIKYLITTGPLLHLPFWQWIPPYPEGHEHLMPIEVLVHVPLFSQVSVVQVSTTTESILYSVTTQMRFIE